MLQKHSLIFNRHPASLVRQRKRLLQIIVFISVLLSSMGLIANGTAYKIKAAYLYQFTKFTQWPEDFFSDPDTPIRICVLGRNPFGKILDSFSTRTSQQRHLSIEYLSSLQDVTNCHIIYISSSEEKRLTQILQRVGHSPILTVSDMENFTRRGGIIGFVPKKRKVGIEINVQASRQAGTKLSSKLLKVATLVKGKPEEQQP